MWIKFVLIALCCFQTISWKEAEEDFQWDEKYQEVDILTNLPIHKTAPNETLCMLSVLYYQEENNWREILNQNLNVLDDRSYTCMMTLPIEKKLLIPSLPQSDETKQVLDGGNSDHKRMLQETTSSLRENAVGIRTIGAQLARPMFEMLSNNDAQNYFEKNLMITIKNKTPFVIFNLKKKATNLLFQDITIGTLPWRLLPGQEFMLAIRSRLPSSIIGSISGQMEGIPGYWNLILGVDSTKNTMSIQWDDEDVPATGLPFFMSDFKDPIQAPNGPKKKPLSSFAGLSVVAFIGGGSITSGFLTFNYQKTVFKNNVIYTIQQNGKQLILDSTDQVIKRKKDSPKLQISIAISDERSQNYYIKLKDGSYLGRNEDGKLAITSSKDSRILTNREIWKFRACRWTSAGIQWEIYQDEIGLIVAQGEDLAAFKVEPFSGAKRCDFSTVFLIQIL
jgi:hypothetical protein